MGDGFSDMIGTETAGEKFGDAVKVAKANATMELRNVALTAIDYVKSFIPVISLLIVFLILLLLVSILSILSRMLHDLHVSETVRRGILFVVSVVLYIWFVGVQIVAAVKEKSVTTIVIASVAGVGFVVIIILFIWSTCRTSENRPSNTDHSAGLGNTRLQKQQTRNNVRSVF